MPKIQKKNKIEQCTKLFIYQDLNKTTASIKLDKSNSVLNYFETKKPGASCSKVG